MEEHDEMDRRKLRFTSSMNGGWVDTIKTVSWAGPIEEPTK